MRMLRYLHWCQIRLTLHLAPACLGAAVAGSENSMKCMH